jgi:transcriptional regulator with XRE-family HTH domain
MGRQAWLRALGDNVRARRLEKGLSQEELADLSGSHRNYIGGVERGERNPTATKLVGIATALNCPIASLFDGLGPFP